MFIGNVIEEYLKNNGTTLDVLSEASQIPMEQLETWLRIYKDDGTTPYPIAMRQVSALAQAMALPMPILIGQITGDQPIEVHVVADSDQPHS